MVALKTTVKQHFFRGIFASDLPDTHSCFVSCLKIHHVFHCSKSLIYVTTTSHLNDLLSVPGFLLKHSRHSQLHDCSSDHKTKRGSFFWTQTETLFWSLISPNYIFLAYYIRIKVFTSSLCSRLRKYGKTGVQSNIIYVFNRRRRQTSLSPNDTRLIYDAIKTASTVPGGHSQNWLHLCIAPMLMVLLSFERIISLSLFFHQHWPMILWWSAC